MLNGTKTFTVSTKPNEDGSAIQTALTIDLEGCSEETVLALAISAAVIKWQTRVRKHGIPERASIRLADLAPGKRLVVCPFNNKERRCDHYRNALCWLCSRVRTGSVARSAQSASRVALATEPIAEVGVQCCMVANVVRVAQCHI